MNRENYKSKRKGQPKRKSKIKGSKRRMVAVAKASKPITSPKLREAYSAKTEWVRNVIPKLKKSEE
jgi:hypothetical protein